MLSSNLYDHPALYDALFPAGAHLPYYVELSRQTSSNILELACGTGQLTVPVASAGLPIVGLDASAPMLNAAKERAAAARVSVEYLLGDMRNFDLEGQFGLIFIARNSLLHLHSTEDILAAFAMVRRHLAPEGIFAFDIFNPSVRMLASPAGQRFSVFQKESESFGTLSVEGTNDYDSATQVNRGHLVRVGTRQPGRLEPSFGVAKHLSAGVAVAARSRGISPQKSRGRSRPDAV